jgi:hypothetical protein
MGVNVGVLVGVAVGPLGVAVFVAGRVGAGAVASSGIDVAVKPAEAVSSTASLPTTSNSM